MPRPAGYQAEMGAEQTQSIWQMAHVFPLLLVDCAKAGSVFYKTNSYLIRELVCGFVWGFFLPCMEEMIKSVEYLLA